MINKIKLLIILLLFVSSLCSAVDLKNVKTIIVAGIAGYAPLEYVNLSGKPSGLYVDFWNQWSKKTGVHVNYIITTQEDALRGVLSGKYDAVMDYDRAGMEDKRLLLTATIFHKEIYIYHNRNIKSAETYHDLVPLKVGALPGDAEIIELSDSRISIIKKESVPMLFDEAEKGNINVFVADYVSASHELSRKGRWKNYFQSSEPLFRKRVRAIVGPGREDLKIIIDSGFRKITKEEQFFLIKTHAGGNFSYTMPWGYIAVVSITLVLLASLLLSWGWNIRLKVTVDRTTAELKRMKEAAEAASEAKTLFLDNISHELRTPLTLILAPIENALNGKPLDSSTLTLIRRNGRNLLGLINDLLDLSKIEAGRTELNVSETDICRLMELYCCEIESAVLYKNISITCTVPDKPVLLFVDQKQLITVLSNLFSNSMKHTDPGGKISISLSEKEDDALVCFSDTGKGIEADRMDTVFDRFTMAHESPDNKTGGTGIGLSLVKGIMELHGGTVAVESRHIDSFPENHGTDFFLTIPKGSEHFHERDDVNFSIEDLHDVISSSFISSHSELPGYLNVPASEDSPEEGEKPVVLVVDDNHDMRNFLKDILSPSYDVKTAVDGFDAFEFLEENPETDLVLSDIMMPRMDGHELLEKMRSDDSLRHIPLLFLSARGDDIVKQMGLEHGAVDYVVKPFSPNELLLRIQKQIEMQQAHNMLMKINEEFYLKLKGKVSSDGEGTGLSSTMKEKMERVCEFINENFTHDINRDQVSEIIQINPDSFSRAFKKYTGKILSDYTNELRLEEAKKLLMETGLTVTRVSIVSGFENLRTFNRIFRKSVGVSPKEFREEHQV